jgi:glycosyltransferase involved in cell wall biosynthesis
MSDDLQTNALISVIIPTYNRGHMIEESIRSVMGQTYENWELIIIDDGSEDDTIEVIKRINNQKIRYIKTEHSGFLGKVRNVGIKMALGEYIAFQDSDDLWRPDKLDVQLKLFEKRDIMFTLSNGTHFGDFADIQPPEYEKGYTGNLFLPLIYKHQFVVYIPSLLFKKEVLSRIDLLDERLKSTADLDFLYRMALQYEGAFSNERLVSIRKHFSMSNQYEEITYQESLTILGNFFQLNALRKQQYNVLCGMNYYKLGLFNLMTRNPDKAFHYFLKYNLLFPFNYKGWIRLAHCVWRKLFYKTTATS